MSGHATAHLSVGGMTCMSCVNSIEAQLSSLPGIVSARVDLEAEAAQVVYDPAFLESWQIVSAIEDCGFEATMLDSQDPKAGLPPSVVKAVSSGQPLRPSPAPASLQKPAPKSTASVTIEVRGMTCASCVASIETALKAANGVILCSVALLAERAEVLFDPTVTNGDAIAKLIDDIGFEASITTSRAEGIIDLQIYGMHCASCSSKIEREVSGMKGVATASVNLLQQTGRFTYDKAALGVRDIIEKIESLGFNALLSDQRSNSQVESLRRTREIQRWKVAFWTSFSFGLPVLVIAMILPHSIVNKMVLPGLTYGSIAMCFLTIPVQFGVGHSFYASAQAALSHQTYTMDVLIVLGTSIAFAFSLISVLVAVLVGSKRPPEVFFETCATLITFVTFGRYLENIAKGRTSDALSSLMSLAPPHAIMLVHDEVTGQYHEKQIASELIKTGDLLKVVPGERIAADGIIVQGSSSIDESLVTGESLPVSKKEGDFVIAGSINGSGMFHFRATRVGSDTTLSHILRLVNDAQTSKAPIQDIADQVAAYFVPAVIILGLGTMVFWLLVFVVANYIPPGLPIDGSRFYLAMKMAISVVIVACPCALGLATPTAVMVGTGVGAQNGILIKGGGPLTVAERLTKVVFDKTGTLTHGKMSVCAHIFALDGLSISEEAFLATVSCAEAGSEHPVGKALCNYSKDLSVAYSPSLEKFESVPGRGVCCSVSTRTGAGTVDVLIGNAALLAERGCTAITEAGRSFVSLNESQGRTVVFAAINKRFAGAFALSDGLKTGAEETVGALRQLGLDVCMITGDQELTANVIASQCGITEVHAGVSPAGKKELVERMQAAGHVVAMVGDGVNDSASIAQSDLGISVYSGSDVAIEAAGIVLMRDDIGEIVTAVHLSRTIFRRIRLNFVWATCYNVLMIPLAMGLGLPWGIYLHPMLAGMAMSLSSVSVVVSSLLLKAYQKPRGAFSAKPSIFSSISLTFKQLFTSYSDSGPQVYHAIEGIEMPDR